MSACFTIDDVVLATSIRIRFYLGCSWYIVSDLAVAFGFGPGGVYLPACHRMGLFRMSDRKTKGEERIVCRTGVLYGE